MPEKSKSRGDDHFWLLEKNYFTVQKFQPAAEVTVTLANPCLGATRFAIAQGYVRRRSKEGNITQISYTVKVVMK